MLSTTVKNWLAVNAGVNSCFSQSGISYKDPDGVQRTGGTGDVFNAFVVSNLIGKSSVIIIANTNYATLKSMNNNTDLAISDATWVYANDGSGTATKYCTGTTPPPSPPPGETPITPSAEIAGVFEFRGPVTGDPSANLDLSGMTMRQHADGHFEMNDIKLINTSSHPVYLAIRIKLFAGSLSACKDTGFVFDGMDRTDGRNIRVKTLEVGETEICDADFFQPSNILGTHTICMLIHGAWSRADLIDEIEFVVG